jgi:hypothetical protein
MLLALTRMRERFSKTLKLSGVICRQPSNELGKDTRRYFVDQAANDIRR